MGTGHNSEIVTDNAGNDWFFYHAVSTKKPEGRVLMLDKISWEDGWPTVEGSVASTEAEKPKFYKYEEIYFSLLVGPIDDGLSSIGWQFLESGGNHC